MAQDDLYFTPKKGEAPKSEVRATNAVSEVYSARPTHSGSTRNVDEYNRRGIYSSYYQKIGTDSLGNDIIEFHSGKSDVLDTLAIYPGTDVMEQDNDYEYSRRMSRFDDYYWDPWYDPYFGRFGYSYYRPYWYRTWNSFYPWYDPWYNTWWDPWFYDYGWGPYWHYGYYGYYSYWGYPYYGYGPYTSWYWSVGSHNGSGL